MIRHSLTALMLILPGVAVAQDFNAAPPNAADQKPAFKEQTRAPILTDDTQLDAQTVASGLRNPWGMAQLPDDGWLITERPGGLRIVATDGTVSAPIKGLPKVDARGQGGLLDVILAPDFAQSRKLWLSYAAPGKAGNTTAVAHATLSTDNMRLENVTEIFRQSPEFDSKLHFGGRLVLDGNGGLFVTLGERSVPEARAMAQDPGNDFGKLVRLDAETGKPAADNPKPKGWRPEIFAMGFRNVQSAALDAQGQLWTVEHGPKGGDELNMPLAGKNYGWPVITYGEEYSGAPVGPGNTAQDGMEQPVY